MDRPIKCNVRGSTKSCNEKVDFNTCPLGIYQRCHSHDNNCFMIVTKGTDVVTRSFILIMNNEIAPVNDNVGISYWEKYDWIFRASEINISF